jgi:DoxX-like family
MRSTRKDLAILILQFVLGVVVLAQSLLFLFGGESAKLFARHGLPNALRLGLGWAEVLAAVLFLAPPTVVLGACCLLVVFAGAMAIHVLHGQFEVGGLLVYAAAALTVLAHRHQGVS